MSNRDDLTPLERAGYDWQMAVLELTEAFQQIGSGMAKAKQDFDAYTRSVNHMPWWQRWLLAIESWLEASPHVD